MTRGARLTPPPGLLLPASMEEESQDGCAR
jgi:hypothetical protein